MFYILDLIGTFAFAISGSLKAKGKNLNIFGVVFMGIVTAVGGGTIRDTILGRTPLFYLKDTNYLLLSFLAGMVSFYVPSLFKKGYSLFRFTDSVGLATFSIIGVSISLKFLFLSPVHLEINSFLVCTIIGILTAVGGGIIRDAMLDDMPFALMHGSNYIISAFWGTVIFYFTQFYNQQLAIILSITITLVLRELISEYGLYKRVYLKSKN